MHNASANEDARRKWLSSPGFTHLLLATVDSLVIVFDHDMRIVLFNKACEELTGWRAEDVLGLTLPDALIPPEQRAGVQSVLKQLLAGGSPAHYENDWLTKDGRRRWIKWVNAAHYDASGRVEYILATGFDATVQKSAARQLGASEEWFRHLLESSMDGIVTIGSDWSIHFASPSVRRLLGYEAAELIGRSALEFAEPADVPRLRSDMAAAQAEPGRPVAGWSRVRRKDGEVRTMEGTLTDLRHVEAVQAIVINFRDSTPRKAVEHALIESEGKYRRLHESMRDAFVQTDMEGRIVDFNGAYEAMLGYPAEEILHQRYTDVTPAVWHALERRILEEQVLKRGYSDIYAKEYRRKDGTVFPVELRTILLRDDEAVPTGTWAIVRDISERRRMEDERHKLEQQLQQAQRLESLGMLAGGIAHDFNNILMAIVGNLDMSLSSLSRLSPARQNITSAVTSAMRAAELCKQMLAFAGRGRLEMETVDLNALLVDLMHMLEISVSRKVALKMALGEGLEPVMADPTQLRQVVMNLVINASEAIGDRDGTIRIATGDRTCRKEDLQSPWFKETPPPGHYVYLDVSDTGCGMGPDTLARIFDPFFTTKFTGRGLGLAGVLGIVRGHKGTIHVTSEKDKGTTFRIYLPVAPPPPDKRVDPGAETIADRMLGDHLP